MVSSSDMAQKDAATRPSQAAEFEEHGWLHVPGLFSRREIQTWRSAALDATKRGCCGDLLSTPGLGHVVYDGRVLEVVRDVLRTKRPFYFGDSSANVGLEPGGMAWHKDNPDRWDGNGPDWKDPFTVVRAGIYLQDHSRHSGGLGIRDRSHRVVDVNVGRPIAVPTEPGDLVVWSLRTTHMGFAARLRLFHRAFFPANVLRRFVGQKYRLPPLFQPIAVASPSERIGLFMTYALRDAHFERYLAYLKTRLYAVSRWRATEYTPELIAAASNAGLTVLDLHEDAMGLDVGAEDKGHVPIPY